MEPFLTELIVALLQNSVRKLGPIVLKCDGLQHNRNIPDNIVENILQYYVDEDGCIWNHGQEFCYNFYQIKKNIEKCKQNVLNQMSKVTAETKQNDDDDCIDDYFEDFSNCTCALLVKSTLNLY